MGSQSRGSSSHVQDSVSPHSSYHTSPSPLPAPAAPASAAAPAPAPPGVMSVVQLVQPIRERNQRIDQPYDVLGPRQGTSDFH
ncbi:hypothetical protein YC2023_026210 [Brassica napus]